VVIELKMVARPPLRQIYWRSWRGAPYWVSPAASTQVGLHDVAANLRSRRHAFHTPSVAFGDTFPASRRRGEAAQMSSRSGVNMSGRGAKSKNRLEPRLSRGKGLTRRNLANMFCALSAGRRA
jgi:hypothetical protein